MEEEAAASVNWTNLGVVVSSFNNVSQDPWDVTVGTTVAIGSVVTCFLAIDNDGDGNDTADVGNPVDSAGNLWFSDAENEVDPGASAAGAFVGFYHSLTTATLTGGSSTITFNPGSPKTAKAVFCNAYSVGSVVSISSAGVVQRDDAVASDAGSLTLGSLSSNEYIFFRAIASEAIDASIATLTSGWTNLGTVNGGSGIADSSSMGIAVETITLTGTEATSDPTMTTALVDRASVLGALLRNP